MVQVNDMIEVAKKSMYAMEKLLSHAADRNNARWGVYGEKFHWFVYEQVSLELEDYDEHVDFLVDWIERRWKWMMETVWLRLFISPHDKII